MKQKRRAREGGFSLVELLVVMSLLGVVGAVMLSGALSGIRAAEQVEAEAGALDEIRIAVERVSRDLREARLVDVTSTDSAVVLWVDADSDYRKTPAETLTWRLAVRVPGQQDLVREDGAGGRSGQTLSFITGIAFEYEPSPPDARTVTMSITYRADRTGGGSERSVLVEVRLRNVP